MGRVQENIMMRNGSVGFEIRLAQALDVNEIPACLLLAL